MTGFTYQDAGVDLDLNQAAMAKLPPLVRRTRTAGVIDVPGGFAGLYRLLGDGDRYEDPVLVSGTDGVGTKIKVALLAGRYDTIGIDLVAMCVNDCLCMGARPLFFLDYVAMHRDDPPLLAAIVEGISAGCVTSGAALLGGETAIMSDLYAPGDFDLAGFCVGVVERSQVIDGSAIRPGDRLIGVASSGLHSNGFSLVRKVVFESAEYCIDDTITETGGNVSDTLLEPTRIYVQPILDVLAGHREAVHGLAHITGGGLEENVLRLLPEGCRAVVDRGTWEVPRVFEWLSKLGPVSREEMFRVFNMGVGFVLLVDRESTETIESQLAGHGLQTWTIGEIEDGERGVELVG